jgi:ankyrin repeat protein
MFSLFCYSLGMNQKTNKQMVVGLGCVLLGVVAFGFVFWVNDGPEDIPDDFPESEVSQPASATGPSTEANEAVLREAALEGLVQQVQTLLKQGTDPNAADENGRTALMLAAFDGYTSTVQELIKYGADIDTCDQIGRTALIYAASGPNSEVVELLLTHKANPNVVDKEEEWTALMFAAAEGQKQVVSLLLGHGADATLKDTDGETASDFAANAGHSDVVKILADVREP